MNEWITIGDSLIRIKDICLIHPWKDKLIVYLTCGDDYAIKNTPKNHSRLLKVLNVDSENIKDRFVEWTNNE